MSMMVTKKIGYLTRKDEEGGRYGQEEEEDMRSTSMEKSNYG